MTIKKHFVQYSLKYLKAIEISFLFEAAFLLLFVGFFSLCQFSSVQTIPSTVQVLFILRHFRVAGHKNVSLWGYIFLYSCTQCVSLAISYFASRVVGPPLKF